MRSGVGAAIGACDIDQCNVFLEVLSALSALAFDPTAITNGLCLFKVSFYDTVFFSTVGLFFVLVITGIGYCVQRQSRQFWLQFGVYIAIFSYPLLSVKIVAIFGTFITVDSNSKTYCIFKKDVMMLAGRREHIRTSEQIIL